jgi:EAL and modified HD-GYP domain-containing signal transduction protein
VKTFILREPIYDSERRTAAYRLSYRGADGGLADADLAASQVIADLAVLAGPEILTAGKKALVTVSRDVLINEFPKLLRPDRTIIDVPAAIEDDEVVATRCRRLADAGYSLAVEHGTHRPSPLLDMAKIVTIRADGDDLDVVRTAAQGARRTGRRTLAIGVPTWTAYQALMELGVDYAAGDYFAKPERIVRRQIPGARLSHMRIVVEVHRPELDIDNLEKTIKLDVSLSYKLLRYINSSYIGTRDEIRSLRHALVMLGQRELKRWVGLIALTALAEEKPPELVFEGMVRARFAELLAPHIGLGSRDQEMFLVGLLSVLDAILDRPLPTIVAELPLAEDIQLALAEPAASPIGALLYAVIAYARGRWSAFDTFRERTGLPRDVAPGCYRQALEWAHGNARTLDAKAA